MFVCELGVLVIDLNFGCLVKIVNCLCGGVVLFKELKLMYDIVVVVCCVVLSEIVVILKMCLGYDSFDGVLDCVWVLVDGGLVYVVVYVWIKVDGYRLLVYWEWVVWVVEVVCVLVFVNGEVWMFDDYLCCCEVSGVEDIMFGCGLVLCFGLVW